MQLVQLELKKRYKSLEPFDWAFARAHPRVENRIEPICLVGINGSGKSQFLELLADIFCYLERLTINLKIPATAKNWDAAWEIEYLLPYRQPKPSSTEGVLQELLPTRVRITKESNSRARFYVVDTNGNQKPILDNQLQFELLPTRIVAYTSGQNETLSHPFARAQTFYSGDVAIQARDYQNKKKKTYFTPDTVTISDTRSFFMDYDSNAAIVLVNYLFGDVEQRVQFEGYTRISDLVSFRLIIRFNADAPRIAVRRTPELEEYVNKLRACATFEVPLLPSHDDYPAWELDFIVNEETRKAFRDQFETPSGLFLALHKLRLLNVLSLPKKERKWHLSEGTNVSVSTNPPSPAASDMVFQIEGMYLKVKGAAQIQREIPYIGLSDGEHQFLHITGTLLMMNEPGTLFLLDEPETHFNPLWRAKFVSIMNTIAQGRQQEVILSTHSPFVVSDCKQDNVYAFRRFSPESSISANHNTASVSFERVPFETYGASYDFILKNIFDMSSLVSDLALRDMQELYLQDDIEILQEGVTLFGESQEKRPLYERIAQLQSQKYGSNSHLIEGSNNPIQESR